MSGALNHMPSKIVQQTLVIIGAGSDPDAQPGAVWPIYSTGEPSEPDSVITVYDTQGRQHGRLMVDGEMQEHHGVQVRVRSAQPLTGFQRARTVATLMDSAVHYRQLRISGSTYIVYTIVRSTDVVSLGKEAGKSRRSLYTINAVVALRMTG